MATPSPKSSPTNPGSRPSHRSKYSTILGEGPTTSFSIQRRSSNYLDEHNAIEKRRQQLEAFEKETERTLSQWNARIEYMFLWFAYCFQEKWARGIKTQCKLLAQAFMVFLLMCTFILLTSRLTDGYLGYQPAEPFCGNRTECYELNPFNNLLDSSTAGGIFMNSLWDTWAYLADPGTHAGEETWPRRMAAFIVTLLGIFMMATVIGFISNIMITMMEDLRTGKSAVVEENHTLLLGWTASTVSLITELVIANESDGGGVIVVLADSPIGVDQKKRKEEIEDTIEHTVSDMGGMRGTKIVIRIGDYTLMPELAKVGVEKARAIVIQAPGGNADRADSSTLRAVLSLRALQIKMKTAFRGCIIAELRDIDNQLLIQTVGGKDVLTVVSHDIIGRIMIKSARNPGLADVYEGLLGFEGAEFYMKCHDEECPEIDGLQFGDLFDCYTGAIPFGVHRIHAEKNADASHAHDQLYSQMVAGGGMEMASMKPELDYFLNPPSTLILKPGDEIVVLAEDDDSYTLDSEKVMQKKKARRAANAKLDEPPEYLKTDDCKKEKILMCGWRRDVDDIIRLLNELTGEGSELHILSDLSIAERIEKLAAGGLDVTDSHVAWQDDSNGSKIWGDDPHDNYLLYSRRTGAPNLRIVNWMGNSSNMRDIKLLGRKLAKFWNMVPADSEDSNARSGSINSTRDRVPPQKLNFDSETPLRRMSSRLAELDNRHALNQFDSILILAEERLEMDAMHSDSNVLASLLLLKDEQKRHGLRRQGSILTQHSEHNEERHPKCTITFEIVDPRTQQILKTNAAITEGSFYIISTHIVAKYLAMVAERKEIHGVLRELLGPEGAEITLINVNKFVGKARTLTFRELQQACRKKEAICLGFVQRVINKETKEFKVYRSGIDLSGIEGSSEPLPKNMDEKMVWSGEDELERIVTDLIVIKGRHHDMEMLTHFGMAEQAKRFSYLTHNYGLHNGKLQGTKDSDSDTVARMSSIEEHQSKTLDGVVEQSNGHFQAVHNLDPSGFDAAKKSDESASASEIETKSATLTTLNRKQSVGVL